MSDEDPTEIEEQEAQALVEALERGHAREALPEDALETAAFLRYSRDAGELPKAREDAVLEDLLANVRPRAQEKSRGWKWLAWLLPVGGLAATAAALLVFAQLASAPGGEPAVSSTSLPAPSAALVSTQLAVANGEAELPALGEQMAAYRGEVLAALDERYGDR